jgi:DNA-binding response OmpR family regulator
MAPLEQPQTEQKKSAKMPKIMIVDDDIELLEELKSALSENYEVEAISNSEYAFDLACLLKPNLIITDLKMRPKNGFMLVDELHNSFITKGIPVIAITGFFTENEHLVMMKMAGMKYALIKPFDPVELIAKIEIALKDGV